MGWNLEGCLVTGRYLNMFKVQGVVRESRVKYGGKVCHTVDLYEPIEVFGATRECVILDTADLDSVTA